MSYSAGLAVLAASDQGGGTSFADRLMLWFHIAFVVFTVGPVTLAVMSSPRAIRTGNVAVLRYLLWMTRIFGAGTLGVFAFGMVLGQSLNDLGKAWLTASMTLYVVAVVVLVLIARDQRRAVAALEAAAKAGSASAAADGPVAAAENAAGGGDGHPLPDAAATGAAGAAHVASVERGRIASLGGIVGIIWLVILVLMIWNG